jgi:cell division protein FtsN
MAGAKKKNSRRGAQRKKSNRSIPKARIVGGLIACVGLLAGVVWLSKLPSPVQGDSDTSATPETVEVEQSTPDEVNEPTMVEIEYDFYDSLPTDEVVVDVEVARQNAGPQDFEYHLQAASFRSETDAERARAELLLKGLSVSIRTVQDSQGRDWHRIMVGPYSRYGTMDEARRTLIENGMTPLVFKREVEDVSE